MEHLRFLRKLIDALHELSPKLKFDKTYAIDVRRTMLYATIVDIGHSIHTMLSNDATTGVRTLMRNVLEAQVDLVNLLNDPEYFDHLEATSLDEWLKTYRSAEGGNAYLASIAEKLPDLKQRLDAESAELDALKKKGKGPLKAFERFRLAGMEEEYRSVYGMLCSDSHNSQRGLANRHIVVTANKEIEVHFRKEFDVHEHMTVIDGMSGILMNASKAMHNVYGPAEESLATLDEELEALREAWAEANS